MHVHIQIFRRQFEKQREHSMAIPRQHISIGPAHRPGQQPILHRAPIDEEILMIGNAAIIGRQPRHPRQPHSPPLHINGYAIVLQLTRDDLGDARFDPLPALQAKNSAIPMIESESDIRPRHRQAADHIKRGGIFAARRAQKFAPRRDLAEEVFDPDPCPRRQCGRAF